MSFVYFDIISDDITYITFAYAATFYDENSQFHHDQSLETINSLVANHGQILGQHKIIEFLLKQMSNLSVFSQGFRVIVRTRQVF